MIAFLASMVNSTPILRDWATAFLKAYGELRVKAHDQEFVQVVVGLNAGDQRPLEQAMGSANAGKPSVEQDGVQEEELP